MKRVLQISQDGTETIYDNVVKASEETGITKKDIYRVLSGDRKS